MNRRIVNGYLVMADHFREACRLGAADAHVAAFFAFRAEQINGGPL